MKKRSMLKMELWVAIIALTGGVIGFLVDSNSINIPLPAYISIIFGFITAASLSLLKHEIISSVDEKFKLHQLINEIQDNQLKEMASKTLEECTRKIEQLSRGIAEIPYYDMFSTLKDRLEHSKSRMLATHVGIDPRLIYGWIESSGAMQWLEENRKAINRGLTVERVFIFQRKDVCDLQTGKISDPRIKEVLDKQVEAGIIVFIAFLEDLMGLDLVEDYIIFDSREVVSMQAAWGTIFRVALKKTSIDINTYDQGFKSLKSLGNRYIV